MKPILILCACFTFIFHPAYAQDMAYVKKVVDDLCSVKYAGRGYVDNGVNKAAEYLEQEFKSIGLKKFDNTYVQSYAFPVNTFPYPIHCSIDKKEMKVGADFIVDAGSTHLSGHYKLLHYNFKDSADKDLLLIKIKQGFQTSEALVMRFANSRTMSVWDTCTKYKHFPSFIIYTEEKKLTHTINTELDAYSSLVFMDSVIQHKEYIDIQMTNEFIPKFTCKNLIGYIKGKRTDSFQVFSAHYDHLGKQGSDAMFPGASDNASGTSMILYLAKYFKKHKPDYNTVFILFSGEEAGLLGSQYFTSYPTFDIQKIKMLINIDIMGNAKNGVTVVNGDVYKSQFNLLTTINAKKKYLPAIHSRGKAHNSDHYYFSEKGIPAMFLYSMGGQGYYHDIYDKAVALQWTNYEGVAHLLIDFVEK